MIFQGNISVVNRQGRITIFIQLKLPSYSSFHERECPGFNNVDTHQLGGEKVLKYCLIWYLEFTTLLVV